MFYHIVHVNLFYRIVSYRIGYRPRA